MARPIAIGLLLLALLVLVFHEAFYTNVLLPNREFQQAVLTHVAPACDVNQALKDTGVDPSNLASANSSGGPNGIQIWLRHPQVVHVPLNAEVMHTHLGYPYGMSYPGENTPGAVYAFTLFYKQNCR